VVGAIALPVLFLTAIAKVRADVLDEGELREEGEHGGDEEGEADRGEGKADRGEGEAADEAAGEARRD
jgi:hypothetical protein